MSMKDNSSQFLYFVLVTPANIYTYVFLKLYSVERLVVICTQFVLLIFIISSFFLRMQKDLVLANISENK